LQKEGFLEYNNNKLSNTCGIKKIDISVKQYSPNIQYCIDKGINTSLK